jgi:lipopolysaccharide/colanic/teichoic acid biosynthesis glycosyltransferase
VCLVGLRYPDKEFAPAAKTIRMIRIFNVVVPSRILSLFVSEVILLLSCYFAAAWLDPDLGDMYAFLRFDSGALRILIVVGIILAGMYFRDLYAQIRIHNRIALLQELCMVFGVAFVVQGLINYLNHDLTLPRKIMILGSVLALISVFCWRLILAATAGIGLPAARLLFLGTSPTIERISKHLNLHPELGLAPAGYLDDSGAGGATSGLIRFGTFADLDHTIETTQPNSIIIGRRETIKPWWTDEFLELHFGGIQTEEAATLYEKTFGRVCATEVRPDDLVFGETFEPGPLSLNIQMFWSFALALLAIILLLPVMGAVAIFLKMRSGDPLLKREIRVGLNGIPFTVYSFQDRAKQLEKTGLHLLPRLLNVLRGDMAMVGPEPERPEFEARLIAEIPFYSQRHKVRPGITGWEQLHRDPNKARDSVRRLEYDLYYLKNLSPSLDSVVLILWLRKLLVGELTAV